jgi:hypothetical protein
MSLVMWLAWRSTAVLAPLTPHGAEDVQAVPLPCGDTERVSGGLAGVAAASAVVAAWALGAAAAARPPRARLAAARLSAADAARRWGFLKGVPSRITDRHDRYAEYIRCIGPDLLVQDVNV